MALLENLLPGNVYLVRISASNQVGDGPFSSEVELAVLPMGSQAGQNSGRYDSAALAKGQRAASCLPVSGRAYVALNPLDLNIMAVPFITYIDILLTKNANLCSWCSFNTFGVHCNMMIKM